MTNVPKEKIINSTEQTMNLNSKRKEEHLKL